VPRDGGGARSIQPEFFARVRIDGDEAFSRPAVCNADHFGGRPGDGDIVVADNIAEQHHLG
jgi:hypothetical protein